MSTQSISPVPSSPKPSPTSGEQPKLSQRPWWARLSLMFAVACAIWILVNVLATLIFGPNYSFGSHTFRAVTTCTLVIAALAVLLRWEHTRASDYAFALGRGMLRGLALGALSYSVPFLMAASVVLMLNLAQVEVSTNALDVVGQGLAVLVLVLLYEAVPEELIFRGYLFRVLSERLPVWATIIGQALLFTAFGAIVGAAASLDRVVTFFLFSVSLGYLRQVTGTVYATIGFHAVFQLLAQWLLGEQWGTLSVNDPEQWFSLVALGLAPFALAPVIAAIIVRSRDAD
jgi:membrane protease YdiL (CAAX protease family)